MAPAASRGISRSEAGRSFGDTPECPRKVLAQHVEIALDPTASADYHMVGPGKAALDYHFARQRPETALHPVSDDGIADLAGDSETYPAEQVAVLAVAHEEHKTRRSGAPAAVRGQEVRTFLDSAEALYALSFLRPWRRRRFRILRPPGVAMRWRNPCRRARTRLLGWKVRFIAHASNRKKKGRRSEQPPLRAPIREGRLQVNCFRWIRVRRRARFSPCEAPPGASHWSALAPSRSSAQLLAASA